MYVFHYYLRAHTQKQRERRGERERHSALSKEPNLDSPQDPRS